MVHISDSLKSLLQASNCKAGELLLNSKKLLKVGNYFSFREKEGTVSYCPVGKEQTFGTDGRWLRACRVDIRPGKLVTKLFGAGESPLPDSEVELFVNKFKALEMMDVEFHIASTSEEINQAYKLAEVNSCMRGCPVGAFYAAVGAKVLYLKKKEEVMGRAILWDKVHSNRGVIKFMDRIYGADPVIAMFKNYARDNDYFSLITQGSSYTTVVKDDEHANIERVKIKFPDVKFYPYMDTFCGASDGCLGTDPDDTYYLQSQNGRCDRDEDHEDERWSEYHEEWIPEDDAVYVNDDYYYNHECVDCHRSGEYILRSQAYEIELSRGNTVYIHENYVTR